MNPQNIESNYKQKENEGLVEFATRLETLWNKEKETTIEIFFKLFIEGIRDNEVKRKTKIWFEVQCNTEIFKKFLKEQGYIYTKAVINTAENFQKEKDEKQKDENDEIVLLETESETDDETETDDNDPINNYSEIEDKSDFDESDVDLSDFELESDFEIEIEDKSDFDESDVNLSDFELESDFENDSKNFETGSREEDGKTEIANLIKSIDESLKDVIVDPEEFQKEKDKFEKEFQKDGKKAIANLIKNIDESLKEEANLIKNIEESLKEEKTAIAKFIKEIELKEANLIKKLMKH